MERLRADLCDRVRALVSLDLDDEASELETAIIEAHVSHCEECREFHAGVSGFTHALRTAVPEAPAQPLRAPARAGFASARSRVVRSLSMASATAVAAAAGIAAILTFGHRDALGPQASLFPRPAPTVVQERWQRHVMLIQRARASRPTGGASSVSAARVS